MANQGRGGAKHFSKPMVDPYLLYKTLHKHHELVTNVGGYETVSRSQGTDAKGLHQCLPLLQDLVQISPTGEIHPGPFRQALMKLVQEKPQVNNSSFNGSVWANMRVERLTVALLHLRRLKTDEEMRKCVAKLTGKEFQELKELAKQLQDKDAAGNENDPPLAKRRELKKEDSEISKDSDGYPKCFESPGKPLAADEPSLTKGGNSLALQLPTETDPERSAFFGKRRKGSGQIASSSSWQKEGQDTSLTKALGLEEKKKNKKRKGAKIRAKKKPAAAAVPGLGELQVAVAAVPKGKPKGKARSKAKATQEAAALTKGPESLAFAKMYYKDAGKAAIRMTQPMFRQLFQFGSFQLSKAELFEICDTAITRMVAGQLAVKDCEAWCKHRFEALLKGA